ncbi:hypothetical protein [Myroides injenensis]|uniref:hypothetical protein n=1 Tax=Myroides injenensis TaxID=1183151 RepID=UPI00028A0C87|nr:hypothetical protein [Myroides injenensis]
MSLSNDSSQFPKEDKNKGNIKVTSTEIAIYNTPSNYTERPIRIDEIEYIYLITSNYSEPILYIYQGQPFYLSLACIGSEELIHTLAKVFHFNIYQALSNINNPTNNLFCLYKTTFKKSYTIVNDCEKDYFKGFEILAPTPIFIPWSITKSELLKCHHTKIDNQYLSITYPVRIGNLIINNLGTYIDNTRPDVALRTYYAKCYKEDGSDKSFYELKNAIDKTVPDTLTASYTNNYIVSSFKVDKDQVTIGLNYSYDCPDFRFITENYTLLTIETNYHYPELLQDKVYENVVELSHTLILLHNLKTPSNYHSNDKIRYTPKPIKSYSNDKTIIWIDDLNNVTGFADNTNAIWFANKEIDYFIVWNILPAKGRGSSGLSIHLKDGSSTTVLEGAHDTIKNQLGELQQFLKNEVKFFEDYDY